MSKISLEGNASGSGTLTIAAPNTNSNFTLSLPTNTGTILTNATAGTVLQVVSATYSTETISTSTSYSDSGLSASITPSSASSKILILTQQPSYIQDVSNSGSQNASAALLRDSTIISESSGRSRTRASTSGEGSSYSANFCYLDSPNTTSSVTYKTQIKTGAPNGSDAAELIVAQVTDSDSNIILMEIAG
jgi:hypothetical protein